MLLSVFLRVHQWFHFCLNDPGAESLQTPFVGPWLDQPSELLAGLKPVEAIERGRLDLVWQVVEGLRSGALL